MSKVDNRQVKLQDLSDSARQYRCRIPQPRPPPIRLNKPKVYNNPKNLATAAQQPRPTVNFGPRPFSGGGERNRPKSANKLKDEIDSAKLAFSFAQSAQSERHRPSHILRKPLSVPKKLINEGLVPTKTLRSSVVLVPTCQATRQTFIHRTSANLPDQETINRDEDLELERSEIIEESRSDLNDLDLINMRNENMTKLKMSWQEKIILFEKMKNELYEKQKEITALYASMGETHQNMSALGQKIKLPPAEELQIMNVTNLSPEQLLQLCAPSNGLNARRKHNNDKLASMPIPIEKLYDIPSQIVRTCDQILIKNKEIIDELEAILSTPESSINIKLLLQKTKNFVAENEMLNSNFKKIKDEYILVANEIADILRISVKETMNERLRNEELKCEISQLNSEKDDLRKQLHESDNRRSYPNRNKVEDLEKQLKDEKCKNNVIKERLSRVTGQAKNNAEQVSQLEAALEQAQSQSRALERTVFQLQEQNEKYSLFIESIKEENASHLQEISEAREKLQAEKEDLEKRITELSSHYNESINNMKKEMNTNVAKIIEIEKKYEDEKEQKDKLMEKVESLCNQLLMSKTRYEDLYRALQEKDLELSKATKELLELEAKKNQLDKANQDIEKYRDRFEQQNEVIKDIEKNLKNYITNEEKLKSDIVIKENNIAVLTNQITVLENQLQASESKMTSYEEQLSSLKNQISQLKQYFGEFEDLKELNEKVNEQRDRLIEATRQNGELANALITKDIEIEKQFDIIKNKENLLEQKNCYIQMLATKEEEHSHIIKLLRHNLEMRTQADSDLNHQLSSKNAEIDLLATNLETTKDQIIDLENSILALKDQIRKNNIQRKRDQEKIKSLEHKLAEAEIESENRKHITPPSDNLDNIIKILEEELIAPLEPRMRHLETIQFDTKNYSGDHFTSYKTENSKAFYHKNEFFICNERMPAKKCADDHLRNNYENKKTCHKNNRKWITGLDTDYGVEFSQAMNNTNCKSKKKEMYLLKNDLPNFFAPAQLREDKKCKMFKIATHKT